METDYISLEAAKEIHCDTCEWRGCCNHSDDNCEERRMFNNIPAADVRPVVKAEWFFVEELNEHFDIYCCKKCGAHKNFRKDELKPYFCEWCGAEMRGSENGS